MPDDSVQVHSIESQALVQTIPPPVQLAKLPPSMLLDRVALLSTGSGVGLLVPSSQRSTKLRPTPISLFRCSNTAAGDDLDSAVFDPL
jgi:vacuolar protein sorting-associated protein 3